MAAGRVYSTFGSALITIAMNWFNRLVGIVSIAILARLLLPEDFGIIAMASLVMALADVLLNFDGGAIHGTTSLDNGVVADLGISCLTFYQDANSVGVPTVYYLVVFNDITICPEVFAT